MKKNHLLMKKLLYQSEHCGTKENDLIFGRFARTHLSTLSEDELRQYEQLLLVPDPLLTAWVTGGAVIPTDWDIPLLQKIKRSLRL